MATKKHSKWTESRAEEFGRLLGMLDKEALNMMHDYVLALRDCKGYPRAQVMEVHRHFKREADVYLARSNRNGH